MSGGGAARRRGKQVGIDHMSSLVEAILQEGQSCLRRSGRGTALVMIRHFDLNSSNAAFSSRQRRWKVTSTVRGQRFTFLSEPKSL